MSVRCYLLLFRSRFVCPALWVFYFVAAFMEWMWCFPVSSISVQLCSFVLSTLNMPRSALFLFTFRAIVTKYVREYAGNDYCFVLALLHNLKNM